jgi:hypothetical protein
VVVLITALYRNSETKLDKNVGDVRLTEDGDKNAPVPTVVRRRGAYEGDREE